MTARRLAGDWAGPLALALSTAGVLLVGWYLLANLSRPAFPVCHIVPMIYRGWRTVLVHHLPLLVGGVVVLAGAGLATRTTRRRRGQVAAVAAVLGVALVGSVLVAVAVCGGGELSTLGSRGWYTAILVAVGAVLAAAGWLQYERG